MRGRTAVMAGSARGRTNQQPCLESWLLSRWASRRWPYTHWERPQHAEVGPLPRKTFPLESRGEGMVALARARHRLRR